MQCPKYKGNWLVRNSEGKFGYAATDNLEMDMNHVKSVAGRTLKVDARKPKLIDVKPEVNNNKNKNKRDDDDDEESEIEDDDDDDERNDDFYDTANC